MKSKNLYPYKGNTYRHIAVWVEANGPVPEGYELHHIDHDPKNSNLSNLMLVTHADHMKIHAGWWRVDGEWWKRCPKCKRNLPLTEFYNRSRPGGGSHFFTCRECSRARAFACARTRLQETRAGEYTCPECGDKFRKPNALGIHRKYYHGVPSQRELSGRCSANATPVPL